MKKVSSKFFYRKYSMSHHQSNTFTFLNKIHKLSSAGVNDDDGDELNSTATSKQNLSEK